MSEGVIISIFISPNGEVEPWVAGPGEYKGVQSPNEAVFGENREKNNFCPVCNLPRGVSPDAASSLYMVPLFRGMPVICMSTSFGTGPGTFRNPFSHGQFSCTCSLAGTSCIFSVCYYFCSCRVLDQHGRDRAADSLAFSFARILLGDFLLLSLN